MKTLSTFVLALGAVSVMAIAVHAQTRVVVVNVPFDFTVQNATMPAGEYELKPLSNTQGAIQIVNLETRRSVLVFAPSALSTRQGEDADSAKVIFNRYGDRYFFSEVWTPHGLRGRAMPSKLEREVKARGLEMASVALPLAGTQ